MSAINDSRVQLVATHSSSTTRLDYPASPHSHNMAANINGNLNGTNGSGSNSGSATLTHNNSTVLNNNNNSNSTTHLSHSLDSEDPGSPLFSAFRNRRGSDATEGLVPGTGTGSATGVNLTQQPKPPLGQKEVGHCK